MSLSFIKDSAALLYKNLKGWRTRRRIVVIESDDWGSIRMPSKDVFDRCLKAGYGVDRIAYEKYDSLASEDDLELLFNLLESYKDSKGKNPVITANVLTSNPHFEKIKDNGYREYVPEPIYSTFARYPKHNRCLDLWIEGLDKKVFFPQSHGREHLNVSLFMKELQSGNKDVHFGFTHQMPGNLIKENPAIGNLYVEALRYHNESDKYNKISIVIDGLRKFEDLFGYKSKSFIAPNYIWNPEFDEKMHNMGVIFYQGSRKMKKPDDKKGFVYNTYKLGQRNSWNQTYLIRNVAFEPSLAGRRGDHLVDKCLKEISVAFSLGKPAIICSHRLNYVGYINEWNRDENLVLLKNLLSQMLIKWPDIEFLNSVELGDIISDYNYYKNDKENLIK